MNSGQITLEGQKSAAKNERITEFSSPSFSPSSAIGPWPRPANGGTFHCSKKLVQNGKQRGRREIEKKPGIARDGTGRKWRKIARNPVKEPFVKGTSVSVRATRATVENVIRMLTIAWGSINLTMLTEVNWYTRTFKSGLKCLFHTMHSLSVCSFRGVNFILISCSSYDQ